MPQEPIATIIRANDPEGKDVTWKEVAQTPFQFLNWIVKRIAVDLSKVSTLIPVLISTTKPGGANQGKIHFQSTRVPRIGVPTEAGYQYFDRYPRNVILGWRGDKPIPPFFTVVPDEEVKALGLPENVTNSLVWVVYPE